MVIQPTQPTPSRKDGDRCARGSAIGHRGDQQIIPMAYFTDGALVTCLIIVLPIFFGRAPRRLEFRAQTIAVPRAKLAVKLCAPGTPGSATEFAPKFCRALTANLKGKSP